MLPKRFVNEKCISLIGKKYIFYERKEGEKMGYIPPIHYSANYHYTSKKAITSYHLRLIKYQSLNS